MSLENAVAEEYIIPRLDPREVEEYSDTLSSHRSTCYHQSLRGARPVRCTVK